MNLKINLINKNIELLILIFLIILIVIITIINYKNIKEKSLQDENEFSEIIKVFDKKDANIIKINKKSYEKLENMDNVKFNFKLLRKNASINESGILEDKKYIKNKSLINYEINQQNFLLENTFTYTFVYFISVTFSLYNPDLKKNISKEKYFIIFNKNNFNKLYTKSFIKMDVEFISDIEFGLKINDNVAYKFNDWGDFYEK